MRKPADAGLESEPIPDHFWAALGRGEFHVPWCDACEDHVWPPRDRCTACLGALVGWKVLRPSGRVYSYTVVHRPAPGREDDAPYVLSYVEVDRGPIVLSNIVGPAATEVEIGERVHMLCTPPGDQRILFTRGAGCSHDAREGASSMSSPTDINQSESVADTVGGEAHLPSTHSRKDWFSNFDQTKQIH